jgi:dolichol-phosphate mannosyltransferase
MIQASHTAPDSGVRAVERRAASASVPDRERAAAGEHAPYISVVSPVYMAERILPALCERLTQTLEEMGRSYEIILVCDGSPDGSWSVMERLAEEYPRLIVVNLSRNFGQHYALTAGMDLASGEWTVVMDCDLQDRPEEIPRLLERAQEGYDIVIARRLQRQHKWWKRVTSRLFFKVFNALSGYEVDGTVGSFRIMRRPVMDGLRSMRESYRMFAGLVEWLGFKTAYLDVRHAPRYEGVSSYNLIRLARMALDGMISFSNRPLYISIAIGMIISLASGLYGSFLLFRAFVAGTETLPGWLSTITATSFIGGIILLNQGVLGIYLGRMYNQTKGRPLYVIDRIVVGADVAGESSEGTGND